MALSHGKGNLRSKLHFMQHMETGYNIDTMETRVCALLVNQFSGRIKIVDIVWFLCLQLTNADYAMYKMRLLPLVSQTIPITATDLFNNRLKQTVSSVEGHKRFLQVWQRAPTPVNEGVIISDSVINNEISCAKITINYKQCYHQNTIWSFPTKG